MELTLGGVWALAGVFLAVVLSGIGSAVGVSLAAQVAAGGISEEPKNFGKFFLMVALPGTQGVYGFLIGFLYLMRLAPILKEMAGPLGAQVFFGALPVGFAGLVSGIYQGKACAAGIAMAIKQPNEAGKGLVMAGIVEFYAILGFVISFFGWLYLFK